MLAFFAVCWTMVIGHQFDLGLINVARYESLAGSLVLAYTGAAMSVCFIGIIALRVLFPLK